jgi:thioredoxin 1
MSSNLMTTTDLKPALRQGLPVLVYLFDSREKADKPLENALESAAKKNAAEVVIARVDVAASPKIHQQYDNLATPALVTLSKGFFGHKVKTQAAEVRPKDIRAHLDYLLDQGPDPTAETATDRSKAEKPGKPATHAVTDSTFKRDVLKARTPVLVDFWAPWCAPCLTLAPHMEKLAVEYKGRVRIAKVNVDENPATQHSYQIQSIPTLIMFKDGQPVERRTGATTQVIRAMIEEALLD